MFRTYDKVVYDKYTCIDIDTYIYKIAHVPTRIRKFRLACKPSGDVGCKVQIALCSRQTASPTSASPPSRYYCCLVIPKRNVHTKYVCMSIALTISPKMSRFVFREPIRARRTVFPFENDPRQLYCIFRIPFCLAFSFFRHFRQLPEQSGNYLTRTSAPVSPLLRSKL